jgi:hypothetical protein
VFAAGLSSASTTSAAIINGTVKREARHGSAALIREISVMLIAP